MPSAPSGYLPPPAGLVSLLPSPAYILTGAGLVMIPAAALPPAPLVEPGSCLGLPARVPHAYQRRIELPDLTAARAVVVDAALACHLLAQGQCVADAEVFVVATSEEGLSYLLRVAALETHSR